MMKSNQRDLVVKYDLESFDYEKIGLNNDSLLYARYRQLLFVISIAISFSFLNFLLNPGNYSPTFNTVKFVYYVWTVIYCFVSLIFVNKEQELSMTIFFWGLAVSSIYLLWISGGIKGVANLICLAVMMASGLVLPVRRAVKLYIFFLAMIFFLGFAEIEGVNPIPVQPFQYENVINAVIIVSVSAAASWKAGSDFRRTISDFELENEKNEISKKEIFYLSEHDSLTGLANIQKIKNAYFSRLEGNKGKIFFYFLDLDDFKSVNDAYNHSVGDLLLIEIANRLKSIVDEDDVIGRIGGDEFLIIMSREIDFNGKDFAEKIIHSIAKPMLINDIEIETTTSVGIAIFPYDGMTFDEVRQKSDLAMYKAKQKGKNHFQYYNGILHQKIIRKNAIVTGLKKAIAEKSLSLSFLGKYNLNNGHIVGAEALVRWVKNNTYNVEPSEFIPIISSTDLIIELDEWVINEACKACARWQRDGHINMKISVNVSELQFSRKNMVETVSNALAKSGVSPHCIEIELTEGLLINPSVRIAKQLSDLKRLGVMLFIDDFGTGYSNLGSLSRLNVDALKLDKLFMYELDRSPENQAVVKAIIRMADIFGLETVAEGLETYESWQTLKEAGCQFGQGFYWGEPVSEAEFSQRLLSGQPG